MPFSISGMLSSLNRYRSLIFISLVSVCEVHFVLFNLMLKYVINRLVHAFFHFRTVIIPRSILTLWLKEPSGRYRSLELITGLIWKRACINLISKLSSCIVYISWFLVSLDLIYCVYVPRTFKLVGFPICWPWVYLVKVIPETSRTYEMRYHLKFGANIMKYRNDTKDMIDDKIFT